MKMRSSDAPLRRRFVLVKIKSAPQCICNYTLAHSYESVKGNILFLGTLSVAAHEAVNASCRIYELALTCIEWV